MTALRVKSWKARARVVSAKAETVGDPEVRAMMMQIVETYEWMVDRFDVSSLAATDDDRSAGQLGQKNPITEDYASVVSGHYDHSSPHGEPWQGSGVG